MRIYLNNSLNFRAHSENTRKMDDLTRNIRKEFDVFSPSYALYHWSVFDSSSKTTKDKFMKKYIPAIMQMRASCSEISMNEKNRLSVLCNSIKGFNLANCREFCDITLAVLFANNYMDSIAVQPVLNITAFDEYDNEILSKNTTLDHITAFTCINSKNSKKELIFLDTWLNKAMSIREAKEEYLKTFVYGKEKEFIRDIIQDNRFDSNLGEKLKNCKYKFKILFEESDDYCLAQKQEIQENIKKMYPNLCK